MEWFNKHLNWTYAIINIVITVIGIIVMFALASEAIRSFIENINNNELLPVRFIVTMLIGSGVLSLVSLGTSTWVLARKGQNLLWLLLILVSSLVLFILVLALPNKKEVPNEKGVINDSDYYQSRGADVK